MSEHPALAGITLADLRGAYLFPVEPQKTSVLEVRIELMRRGTSVAVWADSRGFNRVHTHLAIWGKRRGPMARRIIAALKSDLGIS